MSGSAFAPDFNSPRLRSQLETVHQVLEDGEWHTLPEITEEASTLIGKTCSDASISAKIPSLRSVKNGGHVIESRPRHGGTWEYRMQSSAYGPRGLFENRGRRTLAALR